ncbi:MAG: hypothetical protein GXP42_16310 [Chloroflexi bacterium]|nr:hypothetical protein [Chloroflexota bacterium]
MTTHAYKALIAIILVVLLTAVGAQSLAASAPEQVGVGGALWWDYDGDGLRDEAENAGVAGAVIMLYADDGDARFEPGADDVLYAATVSNDKGVYSFQVNDGRAFWVDVDETSLPVGAALAQGPESHSDPVLVSVMGTDVLSIDFAYSYQGSIAGTVFFDYNRDGVQGLGEEGAAGIDVCLYEDVDQDGRLSAVDVLQECIFTDEQGNYRFSELFYGHYLVMESERPGIAFSTPNIIAVFLDPWLIATAQAQPIGLVRVNDHPQKLFFPFHLK